LHDETGELIVTGFEAQIAAVGAEDFAGEAQAQTGAFHPPAPGGVGAVKSLKDMPPVGWRNWLAGIGHANPNVIRI
jgi:hypothetical protein